MRAHSAAVTRGVNSAPSAADLTAAFDAPSPPTLGLEEELMLLDPRTLDLLPRADDVLVRLPGDPSAKAELPASQLELVTPPCATVGEAAAALRAARARLARAANGIGQLATAGTHPFADPEGVLSSGERYRATEREYGWVARRQLVFGLHVHVAVRPAAKALAVYNALRSHLPLLAALAANAPFYEGRDTELQSIRPIVADLLPRQGIPPPLHSFSQLAAQLEWGTRSRAMFDARQWWWDLRPHPHLGTIEIRVCDAQSGVDEAAAVAAVAHALCVWLGDRYDRGDLPPAAPTWRIEENRWSACRHGVHGTLADLETGKRTPTRDLLLGLLETLVPFAARLGCAGELATAVGLVTRPMPDRHRETVAKEGLRGLVAWLVSRF